MDKYLQNCLVFAARYAHSRQTGAALMVCKTIEKHWSELDAETQAQLKREAAAEAVGNESDWAILANLPVSSSNAKVEGRLRSKRHPPTDC